MKAIYQPIEVAVGDDGVPARLGWRARRWRVTRVLDRWVLQSRWWAQEEKRLYLLVEVVPDEALPEDGSGCTMEIYGAGDGRWVLARVLA